MVPSRVEREMAEIRQAQELACRRAMGTKEKYKSQAADAEVNRRS